MEGAFKGSKQVHEGVLRMLGHGHRLSIYVTSQ